MLRNSFDGSAGGSFDAKMSGSTSSSSIGPINRGSFISSFDVSRGSFEHSFQGVQPPGLARGSFEQFSTAAAPGAASGPGGPFGGGGGAAATSDKWGGERLAASLAGDGNADDGQGFHDRLQRLRAQHLSEVKPGAGKEEALTKGPDERL